MQTPPGTVVKVASLAKELVQVVVVMMQLAVAVPVVQAAVAMGATGMATWAMVEPSVD